MRHFTHYASIFGIIAASLVGLTIFSYDKEFQSAIVVSSGISFFTWGLVHHHIHEDLHPKVIFEYLASAILGITILLSVIWRA